MVDTNFQKKKEKVILAEAQKLVDLCSVIILASLVRGNGLVWVTPYLWKLESHPLKYPNDYILIDAIRV